MAFLRKKNKKQPGETVKLSIGRKLRRNFFTGLLVLVPLILSIYIIYAAFAIIDGLLGGLIAKFFTNTLRLQILNDPVPGVGFIALIVIIFLTGIVARNYFGRKLISLWSKIVAHIPVMNRIYGAIQQIVEAFLSERSEVFKKAVLIEYPRKDIYSIAFVTQDTKGLIQKTLDVDVVSVFLPTTPNPTSGFLLFVPKKETRELNISVEEAMKLVISGGAIVPKERLAGKDSTLSLTAEQISQLKEMGDRRVGNESDIPTKSETS